MSTRVGTRAAAAMLAAATFVLPMGARAVPIVSKIAQCHGVATVGEGPATCTALFELTDARYPSDIESHANFHAQIAGGTVVVEWRDSVLQLQARIVCDAPGLYVQVKGPTGDPVGGGPADLSTYPNCRRQFAQSAYFASGIQTLTVTATARVCRANDGGARRCPFHGYLVLNRQGVPL